MSLDIRSVRTENEGDVVAEVIQDTAADLNMTEANSGDILTAVQLIDDSVYTDGSGTPSKGIAVMGSDGTNPQLVTTDTDGHLQVDVLSGATATEYDEDAATPSTISGPTVMMERDDALSAVTPIEGDWIGFRGTAEGALWVQDFNSDAILADTTAILADTASMDSSLTDIETNTDSLAVVGGGVEATAVRVTIASDSTGVLSIDDNGGSLTVDNGGTFAVQEDGDALTALQLLDNVVHVEDTAHNSGDSGAFVLGVRNDTLAALAGTDGDYAPLQVNASGALYIQEGAALDVSAATVTVSATDLDIRDLTSASDSVEVLQATHDNLNANANIQVGNADVGASNPVPVYMTDASEVGVTPFAEFDESAALAAQATETLFGTALQASKTGRFQKLTVSSENPWEAKLQKVDETPTTTTIAILRGEAGATETYIPKNASAGLFEVDSDGTPTAKFQVVVKNINKSSTGASAAISATLEWDEE